MKGITEKVGLKTNEISEIWKICTLI